MKQSHTWRMISKKVDFFIKSYDRNLSFRNLLLHLFIFLNVSCSEYARMHFHSKWHTPKQSLTDMKIASPTIEMRRREGISGIPRTESFNLHKVNTLPWFKSSSKSTFGQDKPVEPLKKTRKKPVSIINIDHHNRNYKTGRTTNHGNQSQKIKEAKESLSYDYPNLGLLDRSRPSYLLSRLLRVEHSRPLKTNFHKRKKMKSVTIIDNKPVRLNPIDYTAKQRRRSRKKGQSGSDTEGEGNDARMSAPGALLGFMRRFGINNK